jgi:hypothetical protein
VRAAAAVVAVRNAASHVSARRKCSTDTAGTTGRRSDTGDFASASNQCVDCQHPRDHQDRAEQLVAGRSFRYWLSGTRCSHGVWILPWPGGEGQRGENSAETCRTSRPGKVRLGVAFRRSRGSGPSSLLDERAG